MNAVDISFYQGTNIDFKKMKAAGVKCVIIKAGEAMEEYTSFKPQLTGAISAELPVGIYLFSRAYTTDMAKAEANKCADVIKGYKIDLPVFIDFEYDSVYTMQAAGVAPTKDLITNIHVAFCQTINERGFLGGYYTNPDFLYKYVNSSKLLAYYKWIACWGSNAYTSCDLWQSGVGRVDGIPCDVDLDQIISQKLGDLVDKALNPKATPKKDRKTNEQMAIEVIQGKWSVGVTRRAMLTAAGYDYSAIQKIVDDIFAGNMKLPASSTSTTKPKETAKDSAKKTNEQIAKEVIQGKWGAGVERKKKLTAAGYYYHSVQKLVDAMMKKNK